MIKTITLLPGVTLRCCSDSRFRQGFFSLQLIRPMRREEAALNALLPAVLLRGTARRTDLRAITLRLDELYGASVDALVRRIGDLQTTGLCCGFLEDRFAMDGDQVMAPMLDFLRELICEPFSQDGCFSRDYVESEKKNLIATLDAARNDKRTYAMGRLLKIMCGADSFGIPRLGEREQVAAITAPDLWDHYQKLLRESPVELFYVGAAPAGQVAELVREIFGNIPRTPGENIPQTPFAGGAPGQTVTEEMEVTQAKLCLGFVTPITNRDPEFAAMQVLNVILGGGMTSKLFQNVREKRSLCYSIASGYYSAKGILTVDAGIDPGKVDVTREEILLQLESCVRGEITAAELTAAKEFLLSTLRATHDSPGAIEGYYAVAALSGLGKTVAEYAEAVRQVTVAQAAAAAKTLQLHTTYLLRGVTE